MGKKLNLKGLVFDKLTVLSEHKRSNFGKVTWKCQCSCGRIKYCIGSNLVNKRSKSCGSCARIPNLLGKKFGILTVVEYLGLFDGYDPNHNVSMWLCEDDLGLKKKMTTAQLTGGKNIHVNRVYTREIAALISVYQKYKHGANKANREFNIDKKMFIELIQKNCYYCGSVPSNTSWDKCRIKSMKYSGLDRIDTKRGYTEDNVVPCCINCNYAKQDFDLNEFYDWLKRIHENLTKLNVI